MKTVGIDIIKALKRMEELGIVRQMTAEEMRPYLELDLERARKILDERILAELDKRLTDDNNPKTFRP